MGPGGSSRRSDVLLRSSTCDATRRSAVVLRLVVRDRLNVGGRGRGVQGCWSILRDGLEEGAGGEDESTRDGRATGDGDNNFRMPPSELALAGDSKAGFYLGLETRRGSPYRGGRDGREVEWQGEGAEDLPAFAKLVKVTALYAFKCTCFHVADRQQAKADWKEA